MRTKAEIGELVDELADILTKNNKTLSVSESFTGGAVSAAFVRKEGASRYLLEGVTAYSNKAKETRLNVRANTLKSFGAVSAQTAEEMAVGLMCFLSPDYTISTTGYAYTSAIDNPDNGKCFVAAADKNTVKVKRLKLTGSREEMINDGVYEAIYNLLELIKKDKEVKNG